MKGLGVRFCEPGPELRTCRYLAVARFLAQRQGISLASIGKAQRSDLIIWFPQLFTWQCTLNLTTFDRYWYWCTIGFMTSLSTNSPSSFSPFPFLQFPLRRRVRRSLHRLFRLDLAMFHCFSGLLRWLVRRCCRRSVKVPIQWNRGNRWIDNDIQLGIL